MGFADAYLLKAGLRESLIKNDPHSDLKIIVTIPVFNESGLESSLDSLFMAACSIRTEVLILINAAAGAPAGILKQNLATLDATRAWIAAHPHPYMDFHVWLDHSFGKKHAGVGQARKILMDEAARRFSWLDNDRGIITGFDADALVDPNYIQAIAEHFLGRPRDSEFPPDSELPADSEPAFFPDGCSINFEHPLEGELFPEAVYESITQYELHLRYYLAAARSTGYPHTFHTVGSSFAVRALTYCLEGGMNRRKAGEDFYFIQKVAQRGYWSECKTTRVVPSPRPSDRVPFGTGRAVKEMLQDADEGGTAPVLLSYNIVPFNILRDFFSEIVSYSQDPKALKSYIKNLSADDEALSDFLVEQKFGKALEEMLANTGSAVAFLKRFWRWFSMFRIMKFLHHARDFGYPDVGVGEAARDFLSLDSQHSNRELLEKFRAMELSGS